MVFLQTLGQLLQPLKFADRTTNDSVITYTLTLCEFLGLFEEFALHPGDVHVPEVSFIDYVLNNLYYLSLYSCYVSSS